PLESHEAANREVIDHEVVDRGREIDRRGRAVTAGLRRVGYREPGVAGDRELVCGAEHGGGGTGFDGRDRRLGRRGPAGFLLGVRERGTAERGEREAEKKRDVRGTCETHGAARLQCACHASRAQQGLRRRRTDRVCSTRRLWIRGSRCSYFAANR